VGVVEKAIADGVGQRGLAEVVVPLGGGELAGDDRRAAAVAVFEDLEQVSALLILDGGEAPIVELCGAPHKSIHVQHLVMWSCCPGGRDSADVVAAGCT
jgi:hypothetical protein